MYLYHLSYSSQNFNFSNLQHENFKWYKKDDKSYFKSTKQVKNIGLNNKKSIKSFYYYVNITRLLKHEYELLITETCQYNKSLCKYRLCKKN